MAISTTRSPQPLSDAQSRVGPYELLEQVGAGGMGRVFAARDRKNGELVAIKVLLRDGDADSFYSLKREFRVVRDVASPHLVPIYDLYVEDRFAYVAMRLLRGRNLLEWADVAEWQREPELLQRVLIEIMRGMSDLHRAGLVHRDIKPTNIMVEPDGRVVLVDYGVSVQRPAGGSAAATTGGTLAYMPPEALRGDSAPSPAQDLFALGATVFHLVAGSPPPRVAGSGDVPIAVARAQLVRAWARMPPALLELVLRLLASQPEARGSLAQAALALAWSATGPGATGAASTAAASAPPVAMAPAAATSQLIGRSQELDALRTSLAAQPARLFVRGPSGVGKTALIGAALEERAQRVAQRLLCGRCHPGEHVRYRGLDELVDELGRCIGQLDAASRAALPATDLAVAQAVFPVLEHLGTSGDARAPRDPEERRRRLPRALCALLKHVHALHPLVLWIDDVQWADDDAVRLLAQLMEELGASGPKVVVSGHFVVAIPEQDFTSVLELSPLPPADAHALALEQARAAHGPHFDRNALEGQLAWAGGNPALICHVAKHVGTGAPCSSLAEVVSRQLAALSPAAAELAACMALLATPLPKTGACAMLGADSFREHVAELEQAGLIRRISARGDDAVVIAHESVRNAILAGGDGARHDRLRARMAGELDSVAEMPREVLASLWEAAQDKRRARALWLIAGAQAVDRTAFDHAADCLGRALKLSEPDELLIVLRELAHALAMAGRAHESAQRFAQCAPLCPEPERRGLQEQAAIQYLLAGEIDVGLSLLRALFSELGVRLPRSSGALAFGLMRQQLGVRWRALPERSPARSAADDARLADLAFAASTALRPVDSMLSAYVQGLHRVHGMCAGDSLRIARALALESGFTTNGGGDPVRARALLQRARAELGERDEPQVLALIAGIEAVNAWTTGAWSACVRAAQQSERISEERCVGAWAEVGFARSLLQDALRWSGQYRELAAINERYLADARRRGDRFAYVTFRTRFESTLCLVADRLVAGEEACSAAEGWSARGVHIQHLVGLHARAECLLYAGRYDEALELVLARLQHMRFAPLLSSPAPRAKVVHLRGACRLAVAARAQGSRRRKLLAEARSDAQAVRKPRWAYTNLLADLLDAGANRIEAGARSVPLGELATRAESLSMPQYAAALALARAPEPNDRCGDAGALRSLGVVAPTRWAAVLIPGLVGVR